MNDKTTQPPNSNSASAQRQRILDHLRENQRMTTIFARDHLDIPSPAPRVFELRHEFNFNIQTHWCIDETYKGKKHRFAEYVLFPGTFKDGLSVSNAI
ncbi:MAG: helix-turn-helix domain-containing protein [Marinicella sp.]